MDEIEIRPITAIDELLAVEALQQAVWGMPAREIVPMHQLRTAVRAGGVVFGAFAGGTLVGFCYGFLGLVDGELVLYSHMAGVQEPYRGAGVGLRLKRAQREAALARGIRRMLWTFDPLTSLNAYFNLHKLGARARRYHENYYGEMEDELNRGGPSDRLEVDWWLADAHVTTLMAGRDHGRGLPEAAPALLADPRSGVLTPSSPVVGLRDPVVRLEIPSTFTPIRRTDPDLARRWLLAVRQTFQHYFGRGYAAVDFIRFPPGDRGAYLLAREDHRES